ncbi:isochorismatase family protein [Pontibacillus sp. ALD_SL1]|uniref:isochorismatase family protein n=1 Tax=Pontibacillus sp. ALD_SL1 TaxID=2777185 RepID=UPI001A96CC16|nr:isochorismatase family protein [Pontibacillus sp. ALD_SL1]QST01042.1 isochorismatase family protein [Pontibacillus sp. ALD_SL1]
MGLPAIKPYEMPTSKDVPANRVSWEVDEARAVFLIHDMQQYFLNAYDETQAPIPELIRNIIKLKEACKERGIPVVYTAQPGDQDPKDRALLQDFWGDGLREDESVTKVIDGLEPDEEDLVLTKWRYSAFKRTSLQAFLQETGRDQLIISGVYAHIGCMVTATEAFMEDVQSFLVADAVADFSEEKHKMALDYVATRCGFTTTTEQVLSQVQREVSLDSYEGLRLKVAELLEQSPEELSNEENLMHLGFDSIRMMSVVEELRQVGVEIDFMTLAEQPTLTSWWAIVEEKSRQHV